jgi:hypothetical protein
MGSESHLRDSKRFEKFLQKDFAGMGGNALFGNHLFSLSMIVGQLNIVGGFLMPPEYDPPLFIDADTITTFQSTL